MVSVPESPRCPICDWPIVSRGEAGCWEGNCAYRPPTGSPEYYRIKQRKKALAAELPDCEGCIDSREGTHGYGTKQHGIAPAESSEVLSRSQQKRIAAMKGERPPTFGSEVPSVPAFTPGPWEYSDEDVSERGHYKAPEVFSFANEAEPKIIATLACRPNADANGRLIAAATDMYEALQLVEQSFSGVPLGQDDITLMMGKVRAALQKASGK